MIDVLFCVLSYFDISNKSLIVARLILISDITIIYDNQIVFIFITVTNINLNYYIYT